ncbi:MAG: pitrilysin family protein [bacterium]|nr:pitrilysin family protein [bacterium]
MRHTVEEVRLQNGARGLLVNVPDATVMGFQFQFRAGSRYTRSPEIYETAHIMEHMAFGANARFKNEHEFEAEFTKNGAYHNASTSDMGMSYVADCADFEWERILDLQLLSIGEPKFNAFEFEAEKGNVRNELTGYLNNNARLLWPKIQQAFGEKVLTYEQRLKTIENIQLEDIIEHHKRTHTTDNLRFVIAGKITEARKKKILARIEELPLERGKRFDFIVDELESPHEPIYIHRPDLKNINFGFSIVLPRQLSTTEMDAMHALNHILTGTMHSRIFGQARKRGLAYGIYSGASRGQKDSSWDFEGQTNFDTAKPLFELVVQELKRILNEDLTEEELDAMKSYALGSFQIGGQTVASTAGFYAGRYFWDGNIRDHKKQPEFIKQISREKIFALAKEFIEDGVWVLGAVSGGEQAQIFELDETLAELFEK